MEHLEGRVCVTAALEARLRTVQLLMVDRQAHPSKVEGVIALAEAQGVPVRRVSRVELEKLAHGRTHGGVALICGPRPLTTPEQLIERLGQTPLLLLLEGVDDPRNLGFTLRTAEALGVDAVLIKKHLWDFDATDVSRASSGAFERLALVQFEGVHLLKRLKLPIVGLTAAAKRALDELDLSGPLVLAVGGEKRGLSGAVRQVCDRVARIPTYKGMSLALSQAAGIAVSEAARQRRAR